MFGRNPILFVLLAQSSFAHAALSEHSGVKQYQLETQSAFQKSFSKISAEGFALSKVIGAPALPMKTWLLSGRPETIKVSITHGEQTVLKNVLPYPAQEEDCRCGVQK